ncbi:MAG: Uncharacterized protein Athens101426_323, partial [Parcubacteria group bacterium Athens1014_26]
PVEEQKPVLVTPVTPSLPTVAIKKGPSFIEIINKFIIKPVINIASKTGKIAKEITYSVFIDTPIKIGKAITEQGTDLFVKTKDSTVRLLLTVFYGSQPLKITNVQIKEITSTSALITWETNQPATSKMNYGLSTSYGADIQSSKRVTKHSIILVNLKPDALYYFEVMSQNANRYAFDDEPLLFSLSPAAYF